MRKGRSSPLSASFWLSEEEVLYLVILGAILLVGLSARYFYLKKEHTEVYKPEAIEKLSGQNG